MGSETSKRLKSGWLGEIDPKLANLILSHGQIMHYRDRETIYGFDQEQTCLYGISSGVIQMRVTMNEQEPRLGHVAGEGFWFGETEVVTGRKGIMKMTAAADSELLVISRHGIDKISRVHSAMWPALTQLAVMNQNLAIGVADDLMIRNSTARLAASLLRLSSRRNAYQGVPPVDLIPISWTELSEVANLSRASVGNILASLSKLGFVETHRRTIEILNPDGLYGLLK